MGMFRWVLAWLLLASGGALAQYPSPTWQNPTVLGTLTVNGPIAGAGAPASVASVTAETTRATAAEGTKLAISSAGPLATQAGSSGSAAIAAALGFTPYSAANPAGYVTAATAAVSSVAGRTGAITLSNTDIAGFATAASAAAPVQTVAGRTGSVVLAVGDVSGAATAASVTAETTRATGAESTNATAAAAAQTTASAALPLAGGTMSGALRMGAQTIDGSAVAFTGGSESGVDVSADVSTAAGTVTSRTQAIRNADLVNVKNGYGGQSGAAGNGKIATPVVTLSGTSLTVGVNTFAAPDVGKTIVIAGAGVAPTTGPVETVPVTSAGAGYTSVPTCTITDGSGSGTGATCVALMGLQSAALASGGAGCLTGAFEMVLGTDGIPAASLAAGLPVGTPAKITGTVASGAVIGSVVVTSAGLLPALGNLTTAPAYGANCTTAPTFALSYGVVGVQVTNVGATYSTTQTSVALSGGTPTTAAVAAPLIGAPIPPLITTIASYISPTQLTLAAAASTTISAAATKILWATNDGAAFQQAMNAGSGIWIPAGIYWIGSVLNPGAATLTVRGEGMQNTVLAFDNGTSSTVDSGNWTPLFKGSGGGSSATPAGELQFEDVQIRGLLDFGRVNVGSAAFELSDSISLNFDRVKFYQIAWMAMQNEAASRFTVTNSVFDTVMRDGARCRSCFADRVIGNKFIHSDDDSVAIHQANYIQGPGVERDDIIIEGNDFEDSACVAISGARSMIVRGNTFRRCKFNAVVVAAGTSESSNPIRNLIIADNVMQDTTTRQPVGPTNCVVCVAVEPPNALTGVTSTLPGSNAFPSAYFAKPYDYDLALTNPGVAFAAGARAVEIHHNIITRTLPAVANYSAWGFGKMLSPVGFIDPPMPDAALRPTAGIAASVEVTGLSIDSNHIQNVRRGVQLNDAVAAPSQTVVSVSFNTIYDAWEYGIFGGTLGYLNSLNLIGNSIDVDPYEISPGRSSSAGSWTSGFATSQGISIAYLVSAQLAFNTFSDMYSTQQMPYWVTYGNIVRGAVYSGTTGQPNAWTSANKGVGVYPVNVGGQFFISTITAQASANAPSTFGVPATGHVMQAASAPTTGSHIIGDIIWSSAPGTCTCSGWLALTTGSTWTAGTDYKAMAIQ